MATSWLSSRSTMHALGAISPSILHIHIKDSPVAMLFLEVAKLEEKDLSENRRWNA